MILGNGLLADGRSVDVTVDGGLITAIDDAGTHPAGAGSHIDLGGRLLVAAFGEPHAHLDKAYLAEEVPNPAGDLVSAVDAIVAAWPRFSTENIAERAEMAARRLVASGTTAIRSHGDIRGGNEGKSIEALLAVKDRVAHLCDVQVVTLAMPVTGPDGPAGRRLLDQALAMGSDVVGGCPHLDDHPLEAIDHALAAAAEYGRPVDLHFDEVLDVSVQHLPELARRVIARGLEGTVTASHCVSHGLLPPDQQREVARALADAGVAVVTNPRTNLYLQSRGIEQAPPRGLAGVRALLDAGVNVAAGADNVQDPFYVVGRSDPLETATFLVTAAHLSIPEAWDLVGPAVRRVLGMPDTGIAVGAPAELVAIRAVSTRDAIADQPADRMVFHRGELVARTTTQTWMA